MPFQCAFCGFQGSFRKYRVCRFPHDVRGPDSEGHCYLRICGKLHFSLIKFYQPERYNSEPNAVLLFSRCKDCNNRHKQAARRMHALKKAKRRPFESKMDEKVDGPSVDAIWERSRFSLPSPKMYSPTDDEYSIPCESSESEAPRKRARSGSSVGSSAVGSSDLTARNLRTLVQWQRN